MGYRDNYEAWLRDFAEDEATIADLQAIAGDEKEIEDRFYKNLSFGTAGMRGVLGAGMNRMNVYTVRRGEEARRGDRLRQPPHECRICQGNGAGAVRKRSENLSV